MIWSLGRFTPLVIAVTVAFSSILARGQESAPEAPPAETPRPRAQVLLVTGANNHDWEFTSKLVARVLEESGRFDVTVTSKPGETLAQEDLQQYQAIFLDYNGPRWGLAAERRFDQAVRSGVGVVVMHAANNAFPGWIDFETLVGHCWREGTGHGRFHEFDVEMVDRDHPVTRGLPNLIAHPDELYHRLKFMHGAKHRVLAHAYSDPETGGTGNYEPMVMILEHGKGRIFHTPLGHVWRNQPATHKSVEDVQLQLLLVRGTEWAATGEVTVKPEAFGLKSVEPREGPDPRVMYTTSAPGKRVTIAATAGGYWLVCSPEGEWSVQAYDAPTIRWVADESRGSHPELSSDRLFDRGGPQLSLGARLVKASIEKDRLALYWGDSEKNPHLSESITLHGGGVYEHRYSAANLTQPAQIPHPLSWRVKESPVGVWIAGEKSISAASYELESGSVIWRLR